MGGDPYAAGRFQSTPPRGRRRYCHKKQARSDQFQSTPPRGRRPTNAITGNIHILFQSTPPRGRRPSSSDVTVIGSPFQSTPPRGRRLDRAFGITGEEMFQSTPPRGRRQAKPDRGRRPPVVSIHASAREATQGGCLSYSAAVVSIHASAREATCLRCGRSYVSNRFNPRLRAGGDPRAGQAGGWQRRFNPRLRAGGDVIKGLLAHIRYSVSIHASAREATRQHGRMENMGRSFNPRLRAGGDLLCYGKWFFQIQFQSTPPRGRRHPTSCNCNKAFQFQSTPPRGRRPTVC